MTAKRREITKIVDIRGFGIPEKVPIEFNHDVTPEDELLKNYDLDHRTIKSVSF
jgi:hypothetical protein